LFGSPHNLNEIALDIASYNGSVSQVVCIDVNPVGAQVSQVSHVVQVVHVGVHTGVGVSQVGVGLGGSGVIVGVGGGVSH
jgi:hypothetical protein